MTTSDSLANRDYAHATHESRRILRNGTYNARDAGDYPVATTGRWMRAGTLYRADALAYLDAADVAEAERIGLRLVVDLRDPHERDHDVDVAIPGCANVSVMLYEGTLIRFTPENYPELPDLYEALLTRHIGQVVTALDRIAAVLPDPVLVHCSAGKDRTGIIVALLQSIAGVPLTTILEDYSASEQLLGDAFTERLGQLLDRAGLHRGVLGPEPTASPGHYLGEALSVVTDQHGSIEAFLLRNGLGETAIERIRTGLTVPTTERARPVRF